MNKGIVMEIQKESVTVLTKDGQFISADKRADRAYKLGEEITFSPVKRGVGRIPSLAASYRSFASIAAVFVLVMASVLFSISLHEQKVYAYVTMDINPSFELSVNDDLEILDIFPLNKEAELVLENMHNWEHQSLDNITASLVEKSKEAGYLIAEKTIVFSTVVVEGEEDPQLNQVIENVQNEIEIEEVEVKLYKGTDQDRKKASEKGISTGKFIENKREGNHSDQNNNVNNGKSDEKGNNGKSKDKENKGNNDNKDNKGKSGNNGKNGNNRSNPGEDDEEENNGNGKDKGHDDRSRDNDDDHRGYGRDKDENDDDDRGYNKGNGEGKRDKDSHKGNKDDKDRDNNRNGNNGNGENNKNENGR